MHGIPAFFASDGVYLLVLSPKDLKKLWKSISWQVAGYEDKVQCRII
jgi:hypothetical protein